MKETIAQCTAKKSQIKFINNTEQMWKINYIN